MGKKPYIILAAGILTAAFVCTATVYSDTIKEELTASSVKTVTPESEAPVMQAKKSLWKATRDYAAGKYAAAAQDLGKAGAWLKQAEKNADGKTRSEAKKMGKDIYALTVKLDRGGKETLTALHGLLFRSKALAEREAERVAAGLQNLSTASKVKAHLIDAKLHLAYAESEQFIYGKPADVKNNLDRAGKELHAALELADESVMNKIAVIEKEIDTLKAKIHDKEEAVESLYEKTKAELRRLIRGM